MFEKKNQHLLLALGLLASTGGLSGCVFDEGLVIANMSGTIVIPEEAAIKEIPCNCEDADGNGVCDEAGSCPFTDPPDSAGAIFVTEPDIRNIGPVYVGLYPDIEPTDVLANYPHPEVGPIFQDGIQGDTYPYGGTTVGDLRFACFDALTCKVTSGRWESYDAIVEWFNDYLQQPVVDADSRIVENGEYFRQTCLDLMEVTSDEEVMLLPPDVNGDGQVQLEELDFVYDQSAGEFRGEFKIWQQDFAWDRDDQKKTDCTPGLDCKSFKVWAFMDGPGKSDASFVTCDNADFVGFEVEEYNHDFFGGRVQENVLNQPDAYIGAGDWVANQYEDKGSYVDGHYEWKNIYDRPVIRLGHEVTE